MKFIRNHGLYKLVAICGLVMSNLGFAIHGDIQSAIDLRKAIELNPYEQKFINSINTTSKSLPLSRGFHQKDTCLCWSYGFFNALETISLINDPNSRLELSRGAMQYINIRDRIIEKANGVDDHINTGRFRNCGAEGGTVPDAFNLISKYGVLQYTDYHDVLSPNYSDMVSQIFAESSPVQQYQLTESLLLNHFRDNLPQYTYYKNKFITSRELAQELVGEGKWVSYSISKDGTDYKDKSLDPDARVGGLVNFTSRERVLKIITDNLEANSPVLYGNDHHLTMVYGVEYDTNKNPISLFIKDSYDFHQDNYTYKASVERLLNELGEITVYQKD